MRRISFCCSWIHQVSLGVTIASRRNGSVNHRGKPEGRQSLSGSYSLPAATSRNFCSYRAWYLGVSSAVMWPASTGGGCLGSKLKPDGELVRVHRPDQSGTCFGATALAFMSSQTLYESWNCAGIGVSAGGPTCARSTPGAHAAAVLSTRHATLSANFSASSMVPLTNARSRRSVKSKLTEELKLRCRLHLLSITSPYMQAKSTKKSFSPIRRTVGTNHNHAKALNLSALSPRMRRAACRGSGTALEGIAAGTLPAFGSGRLNRRAWRPPARTQLRSATTPNRRCSMLPFH